MFRIKEILFLIGIIFVTITSCDRGTQVTIKKSADTSTVNAPTIIHEASINNTIVVDASNINVVLARGSEFYGKHEFENAFYQFSAVYQFDTTNLSAILNIANLYYDTQQYNDAITFYQKSLQFDPDNLNSRCDMATCYSIIGKVEKAIEINKKIIEHHFDHAQSHHNLAVFYKQLGKIKEADEETKIYNQILSKHNH